jgi:hypothetical protein
MKVTKTIHYLVIDGGDGSAYPAFHSTKELAERHEDMEFEYMGYTGFAESTVGSITVEYDTETEK